MVYFYLTDPNSTTIVMPGAYSNNNFTATFMGLVATMYTLSAVAIDSAGTCWLTNCQPVSLVQADCCSELLIVGVTDNSTGPFGNGYLISAFPTQQLVSPPGSTFQLQYRWYYNGGPVGTGAVTATTINPNSSTNNTISVVGAGPNAITCGSSCCTPSISARIGTACLPGSFTLTPPTVKNPTSPFANDGIISVSGSFAGTNKPIIYFLTPEGTYNLSQSIYDNSGSGVTFSNLPVGDYCIYALLYEGMVDCISYCNKVSLTAPADAMATLTISQVTNQCGNYVDLVAIPGSTNTKPSTSSFIQDFVWTFSPDIKTAGCVVGTGPTLSVNTSGYYTVTASYINNNSDCSPGPCKASGSSQVTLSACNRCICPAQITVKTPDKMCICAGEDLILEVSASSSSTSNFSSAFCDRSRMLQLQEPNFCKWRACSRTGNKLRNTNELRLLLCSYCERKWLRRIKL